jgi:hypothetical protein
MTSFELIVCVCVCVCVCVMSVCVCAHDIWVYMGGGGGEGQMHGSCDPYHYDDQINTWQVYRNKNGCQTNKF